MINLLPIGMVALIAIINSYIFAAAGPKTFSDNFNRANSGTLGASYVQTFSEAGGSIGIDTNRAGATNINDGALAVVNATGGSWPNNQSATFTWVASSGPTVGVQFSLVLRSTQASPLSAYWAIFEDDGGWTLYKFVSGTGSVINSGAVVAGSPGDIYYFEVNGTTLTLKRNGVTITTETDSSISGGYPGISVYCGSTNSIFVDDFSATSL